MDARLFVKNVAENVMMDDDPEEAVDCLNKIIMDARSLASELGIRVSLPIEPAGYAGDENEGEPDTTTR